MSHLTNKPQKSIARIELIAHLRRYRCFLKRSGRWGEIYWREIIGKKEFIPRAHEISSKLAKKICDGLDVNYPEDLRERTTAGFDRTFEGSVRYLREQGYSPIRKRRFHMFTYTPPKDSGIASSDSPFPVNWDLIPLDSPQELDDGEFWVPVGFDGFKTWEAEACAPPWIKGRAKRNRWCKKYWQEKKWPDHGETSEDPTRFINTELGGLKCELKGSANVPEKHRERLREKLQDLGVIGSEYLADAIELALKVGGAPPHQQVSKENLLNHEGISSYVNADITRILELAFRAGRVSSTHSTYYRGTPAIARAGAPLVYQQKEGKKRKPLTKQPSWNRSILAYYEEHPDISNAGILSALIQNKIIIDNGDGRFTWAGDEKSCMRQAVLRRIRRFINTYKSDS